MLLALSFTSFLTYLKSTCLSYSSGKGGVIIVIVIIALAELGLAV